jgi:hypothetical protein
MREMRDNDINFSYKASWEHSWRELFSVLGKRNLSMHSKIIGFKPVCLIVAKWLLVNGHIRDWIWFCVLVILLYRIIGLKVISRWRDIDHE